MTKARIHGVTSSKKVEALRVSREDVLPIYGGWKSYATSISHAIEPEAKLFKILKLQRCMELAIFSLALTNCSACYYLDLTLKPFYIHVWCLLAHHPHLPSLLAPFLSSGSVSCTFMLSEVRPLSTQMNSCLWPWRVPVHALRRLPHQAATPGSLRGTCSYFGHHQMWKLELSLLHEIIYTLVWKCMWETRLLWGRVNLFRMISLSDDRENLNCGSKTFARVASGALCEDPETRGSRNRRGLGMYSGVGRPVGIQWLFCLSLTLWTWQPSLW